MKLAFGRRISWEANEAVPEGHTLSFSEAIHKVSNGILWKVVLPDAAMGMTAYTRELREALSEIEVGQCMNLAWLQSNDIGSST